MPPQKHLEAAEKGMGVPGEQENVRRPVEFISPFSPEPMKQINKACRACEQASTKAVKTESLVN